VTDSQDHTCEYYTSNSIMCGTLDDDDFSATEMCCGCGGGNACVNSDVSSTGDPYGDGCDVYRKEWCGGQYDDEDFSADSMCCICGGGAAEFCYVPAVPRGSSGYLEPECIAGARVPDGQICSLVADNSSDYTCVSPGQCTFGYFSAALDTRCRQKKCSDSFENTTCSCSFSDSAELLLEMKVWKRDEVASESLCNTINHWRTGNVADMSNLFANFDFTGTRTNLTNWNTANVANMRGMFRNALFDPPGVYDVGISHWDTGKVTNMDGIFENTTAFNMDISKWDVRSVTSMDSSFRKCESFNSILNGWNVARVESMRRMFENASTFDESLSNWDTRRVSTFVSMFENAVSFRGIDGLERWNTGAALSLERLFRGARAFNGDVSNWNVSDVTSMKNMFAGASAFNSDLSSWNTASVNSFEEMFNEAVVFESNLSLWNTSSVTSLRRTFRGAIEFGQSPWDLNAWNTARVRDMSETFAEARRFVGRIDAWNTAQVTTMQRTFEGALDFNGNLSTWNTSRVRSMKEMFLKAEAFTGGTSDLAGWDVSKVSTMNSMFRFATRFSGSEIENWNTISVSDMYSMFYAAVDFDADLSKWQVDGVTDFDLAFEYTPEYTDCHKSLAVQAWITNIHFMVTYLDTWNNYGCRCAAIGSFMSDSVVGARTGCDPSTILDTRAYRQCELVCDIGYAPQDAVDVGIRRTKARLATCPLNATDGTAPWTNLTCKIGLSSIRIDCETLPENSCDVKASSDTSSLYGCDSNVSSLVVGQMQAVSTTGGDILRFTDIAVPEDVPATFTGEIAENTKMQTYALKVNDEFSGEPCVFEWWNGSATLSCRFPSGVGIQQRLALVRSDDHHTGLLSNCMFDYAKPIIVSLNIGTDNQRCKRRGGEVLTLRGRHFGQRKALVFINGRECTNLQHGEEGDMCPIIDDVSCHRTVRCVVPPLGVVSSESNSMVVITGTTTYRWMYSFRYERCEKNFFQREILVNNYSDPSLSYTMYSCAECPWGQSTDEDDAVSCTPCTIVFWGSEHCNTPVMGYVIASVATILATVSFFIGYRSLSKQKKKARELHRKNFREKMLGYHDKQTLAVKEYVESFEKSIRRKNSTHSFLIKHCDIVRKERIECWDCDVRFRGELDLPTDKDIPVTVKALQSSGHTLPEVNEDVVRALHILSCHPRMTFVYGYSCDPDAKRFKLSLVTEFAYCSLDHVLWSGRRKRINRGDSSISSNSADDDGDDDENIVNQSELLRRPSWEERLRWACDVAEALAWLRARHQIHGRLTSMACKLSLEYEDSDEKNDEAREFSRRLKVGDLATEMHISRHNPDVSMRKASVPWIAPEILDGDASRNGDGAFEGAADIYAFGVIMSELYSLHSPWPGRWQADKAEKCSDSICTLAKRGERPSLRVETDAPLGFYHLMSLCWRQNARHRPKATVVARKLREIIAGASKTRNFSSHRRLNLRHHTDSMTSNIISRIRATSLLSPIVRGDSSRRLGQGTLSTDTHDACATSSPASKENIEVAPAKEFQ